MSRRSFRARATLGSTLRIVRKRPPTPDPSPPLRGGRGNFCISDRDLFDRMNCPAPPGPPQGRGKTLESFMTPVAHRFFGGALAGAEPRLFGHGRLVFDRAERRALVRAVTKRLRLGTPAGAPPIALAGFQHDRHRTPAADL